MRAKAGAAIFLVAVGGTVAACGSTSPGAAGVSSQVIFDPCHLTAQQLAVVGDRLTSSKYSSIGEQDEETRSCTWGSDWYSLGIQSIAHSFADTQRNSSFDQLAPIEFPGRAQAARFTSPGETFAQSCGVVVGVPHGVVVVSVNNTEALAGGTSAHNTCDKATEITEKLDRYFPR